MADLRDELGKRGYENVRTLLNSGNVVLEAGESAVALEHSVSKAIADRFGLDIAVMVRRAPDIAGLVKANPLGDVTADGSRRFVAFCASKPDTGWMGDYDNEPWTVRGRELIACCPDGLSQSLLFKELTDKKLGTRTTVRNWNTVEKLHAACAGR